MNASTTRQSTTLGSTLQAPRRATATILLGSALAGTALLIPCSRAYADTSPGNGVGLVIAQDASAPPAPPVLAPDATIVGIDADFVAGLTITGAQGRPVTITTAGQKPRMAQAPSGKPVIFRNLLVGKTYTVAIDGVRIGTAVPLAAPGAAYALVVTTTSDPSALALSWQHQPAAGEGEITYDIAITQTGIRGAAAAPPILRTTTDTTFTATGLDRNALYSFTVTPRNSAATGAATSAAMSAALSSLSATPTTPVQVATPAPAPAAAPAPAPSGPSTQVIYVCPDGFSDAGSTCQKLLTYTFHAVTTTSPYTYHQQFIQTGSHVDYSASPNGGTYYAQDQWNPNDGSAAGYYLVVPDGYTTSVKDAAPAGWTDNGSGYSKTSQVKDPTPSGYSDNGSAWVMTAAKIAKVVPA